MLSVDLHARDLDLLVEMVGIAHYAAMTLDCGIRWVFVVLSLSRNGVMP